MDPLTTSAMISGVVTYLAKRIGEGEATKKILDRFGAATLDWLKPIFLKEDETDSELVTGLRDKPDSPARRSALASRLAVAAEDAPAAASVHLQAMLDAIAGTDDGARIVNNITNSSHVITGNVDTGGGDFRQGDGR